MEVGGRGGGGFWEFIDLLCVELASSDGMNSDRRSEFRLVRHI